MQQHPTSHQQLEVMSLLQTVVALLDQPAAAVDRQGVVLGYNTAWADAVASPDHNREFAESSGAQLTLDECLRPFENAGDLLGKLSNGMAAGGSSELRRAAAAAENEAGPGAYRVRWLLLTPDVEQHGCLLILLMPQHSDFERDRTIAAQHTLIEQLLLRLALNEENERRRIGQVLHDVVVQDMAQVRALIKSCAKANAGDAKSAGVLPTIDRVIETVLTLTFDLSPPVLSDIGLFAAIQWLGEHLGKRYGVRVEVNIKRGGEPTLTDSSKVILFRSVRELIINAAKHASSTGIVVEAFVGSGQVQIVVTDDGCGFDRGVFRAGMPGFTGFGLLSIERKIRGIGGGFELVSSIGGGTRVTLTMPLAAVEGSSNGKSGTE